MDIDVDKYKDEVETLLVNRYENGVLESEVDFIAGVSIAYAKTIHV